MNRTVCLYFKVHQPYRLKKYTAKDIGESHGYEDKVADKENINRLADSCYLPANEIIYQQIIAQKGKFRISFAIGGMLLELLQRYRPDVIQSFKKLATTGCVEFLAEPYYNSLSSLYSATEFRRQVLKHTSLMKSLFGFTPTVFTNTEMIHNNRIADWVAGLGFRGIVCEGTEKILKGRNANCLYTLPGNNKMKLLLRHAALSDDISFRFGDRNWSEHPLTASKYAGWLHGHSLETEVINVLLDYETFGVHKTRNSGIFEFLAQLPAALLQNESFVFSTPSELVRSIDPKEVYNVAETISWGDQTRTHYAWCENVMQNNTLKKIYSIENLVMSSRDEKAMDTWGRLQAADYFLDMGAGGAGKTCPSSKPQEVFQYYTNLVADFEISLIRAAVDQKKRRSTVKNIPFNILSN